METPHRIGWKTATILVISNMIGTGVFTSLGYQLVDVKSTWGIIILWLLGGILALIGAFTFAELGTHYKVSGGDYIFVSRGLHPFLGYLSAWTSMIVGFSAPVAISALAIEAYVTPFQIPHIRYYLVILIIFICIMHSISIKQSSVFQTFTTVLKIVFIVILLGVGFTFDSLPNNALDFTSSLNDDIRKTGFAVSLLYVTYAFTGWNAAAYIVGEIKSPRKNLPKSLITATLLVTCIYIVLQLVFLKLSSYAELKGQPEVVLVMAKNLFSASGVKWISLGIGLQLIATMSSYIWIGSRVIHAMALDYSFWKWLTPLNTSGVPVRATIFQCSLVLVLLFSGSLQSVLIYSSFLLQLMGTLAVVSYLGIRRNRENFISPFSPYLQIVYIVFSVVVLSFIIVEKLHESLIGLGILLLGSITYFLSKR